MALAAASNTLITPTIIAKEALMMLSNNMVMGKLVHREYRNEFQKVGTAISLRKPWKVTATAAKNQSVSDVVEYYQTFTVATQVHVSWQFSSVDLTHTVDEYSKRYIEPAAMALANSVDVALLSLYNDIGQSAGTPGVTPNTYAQLGDAQVKLDDAATPFAGRVAVLSPAAHWAMADGLKGTFAQKPVNDIHTKGYLGTVANLDMHMDQNVQRHTTGVHTTAATPLINTVAIAGEWHLDTDGWSATSNDVHDGDVFTMGQDAAHYVYSVNPVSGDSTGVLLQVSVLNQETSAGSAISIDCLDTSGPGWRATGGYKNCSQLPPDGASLNFMGTESTPYPQNLIFHPNAFGLVTLPMAMPAGVWGSRVTDKQMALSIRVVKDYDVYYDEEIIRLDILYGVSTLYGEMACRLWG